MPSARYTPLKTTDLDRLEDLGSKENAFRSFLGRMPCSRVAPGKPWTPSAGVRPRSTDRIVLDEIIQAQ
jgi:hypothetical protein